MGATSLHKDPKQTALQFFKKELRFGCGHRIIDIATHRTGSNTGAYYVLTEMPDGTVSVMVGSYGWMRGGHENFFYRDCYNINSGVNHCSPPVSWLERITPLPELSAEAQARIQVLKAEIEDLERERREVNMGTERERWLGLRDKEIQLGDELRTLDENHHAREWLARFQTYADFLKKVAEPGHYAELRGVTAYGVPITTVQTVSLNKKHLTLREVATGRVINFPRSFLSALRFLPADFRPADSAA